MISMEWWQSILVVMSPTMVAAVTIIGGMMKIWGKVQQIRKDDKQELKIFAEKLAIGVKDEVVGEVRSMKEDQSKYASIIESNRNKIDRIEGVLIGSGLVKGSISDGIPDSIESLGK